MERDTKEKRLAGLTERACSLGATAAGIIAASSLVVEDRFAAFCAAPHACASYGLAPGCPPHAMKPEAFRGLLREYQQILVFKIDVPVSVLLGPGRLESARTIHCIAAAIEQEAHCRGWSRAQGLAAGSCKELFCPQEERCVVLEKKGPCPHADQARPSLSALGVNFTLLAQTLGWQFQKIDGQTETSEEPDMGLMAGMVLLA